MGQPVKLSDSLVLDARIAGEAQERSIAGQVEFWARLGQSIEPLLRGRQVLDLRRKAASMSLREALATVDTPAGRKRVADVLSSRPYPHYEPHPTEPAQLIRIDEDGIRTTGRFVNRVFVETQPHHKSIPVRGGHAAASASDSRKLVAKSGTKRMQRS
jgi:hypothetical protein